MNASGFDYSAIWRQSGQVISDPWVQAKDLATLFPARSVHHLRRKFSWARQILGKQLHQPMHVAELAFALDIPLAHVVDSVKAARGN